MNLNSRILGSSEKKLVILHGFLGSLDNWITIGRKLEQLNLEVHLVDLRNHGNHSGIVFSSRNQYVEHVLSYKFQKSQNLET